MKALSPVLMIFVQSLIPKWWKVISNLHMHTVDNIHTHKIQNFKWVQLLFVDIALESICLSDVHKINIKK